MLYVNNISVKLEEKSHFSILHYFFKKYTVYFFFRLLEKSNLSNFFFSLLCASACIIVAVNIYCLKKFNEVLILWVISSQLLNVILNILSCKVAFNPIFSCSLLLVLKLHACYAMWLCSRFIKTSFYHFFFFLSVLEFECFPLL